MRCGEVRGPSSTAQITAATFVPGVPAHSWQATSCTGMSIGFKGMQVAAKAMALTVGNRPPPFDYRKDK